MQRLQLASCSLPQAETSRQPAGEGTRTEQIISFARRFPMEAENRIAGNENNIGGARPAARRPWLPASCPAPRRGSAELPRAQPP